MDILIQQDGRIQMNRVISSHLPYYRTIELSGPIALPISRQMAVEDIISGLRVRHIERTFVRLGTVGAVTVWVEQP